jgi:hypothetical protein
MIAITTTQPASAGSLKQVIIRHPLVAFFVLAAEDMPHYLIAHLNDGRYDHAVIPWPAAMAELQWGVV